tara:strand:- start:3591 stop:4067 length:477 start_codon:yes stop_codon:yes gene_type:complete
MKFIPESPNIYQGNQVVINSDRLLFNAKEDAILLYSNKAIGFSTNGNFHFDTDTSGDAKFVVNVPNIYLGLKSLTTGELPTEPAVLGHELKNLITLLCNTLDNMTLDMAYNVKHTVSSAPGLTSQNPGNATIVTNLKGEIQDIRDRIDEILSKNTKLV